MEFTSLNGRYVVMLDDQGAASVHDTQGLVKGHFTASHIVSVLASEVLDLRRYKIGQDNKQREAIDYMNATHGKHASSPSLSEGVIHQHALHLSELNTGMIGVLTRLSSLETGTMGSLNVLSAQVSNERELNKHDARIAGLEREQAASRFGDTTLAEYVTGFKDRTIARLENLEAGRDSSLARIVELEKLVNIGQKHHNAASTFDELLVARVKALESAIADVARSAKQSMDYTESGRRDLVRALDRIAALESAEKQNEAVAKSVDILAEDCAALNNKVACILAACNQNTEAIATMAHKDDVYRLVRRIDILGSRINLAGIPPYEGGL